MTSKVSPANSSGASPAVQNNQPNKVSEFAKKTFRNIKNIPDYISKKIKATYYFLASHKFAIAMIAMAIIFAPISAEASAIAITLGSLKEGYRYYTRTINYQFKLKAKTYIKALTDLNSNFKDGKISTSKGKAEQAERVCAKAQSNLLNHIASKVTTKAQLDSWEKHLKGYSPQLKLNAKIDLQGNLEILSSPQAIKDHVDSQMSTVKRNLENRYFSNIEIYANSCLENGKKSALKSFSEVFMKKIPFAEKVLEKNQTDILRDLNWSYQTQRVKRAVTKAIAEPFGKIANSKAAQIASIPVKFTLGIAKFVSPALIPACIIGYLWGGMPRTLQILTYPTSLFTKFMCWTGNQVACNASEMINNIGATI
ncbi:MAG: hypothetical protein K1000chlam1_00778 [Candidatus Anoxychlamydiales bacterium]|nr:hypothetical protein [Candidatus Anoxychlamydiales bacterium]